MQRAKRKINLIFLAACDSEEIGKVFSDAGIEHVICVAKKRYVKDEVAINFTYNFYTNILQGEEVCSAFDSAIVKTVFRIGGHSGQSEVSLFKLLKASDYHDIFEINY